MEWKTQQEQRKGKTTNECEKQAATLSAKCDLCRNAIACNPLYSQSHIRAYRRVLGTTNELIGYHLPLHPRHGRDIPPNQCVSENKTMRILPPSYAGSFVFYRLTCHIEESLESPAGVLRSSALFTPIVFEEYTHQKCLHWPHTNRS